jgi:hypothetical protein
MFAEILSLIARLREPPCQHEQNTGSGAMGNDPEDKPFDAGKAGDSTWRRS